MERGEPASYDYYVVDTLASEDSLPGAGPPAVQKGQPVRLYYRADRVERVVVGESTVRIWRFPPDGGPAAEVEHAPASITRRDGLTERRYALTVRGEVGEPFACDYAGDTYLIDEEEERPFCFVVDVRVPSDQLENVKLDKVRAIVDLEKPAHTEYYLKLTPVVSAYTLQPMQLSGLVEGKDDPVRLRSTIGWDTIIG